MIFKIPVYIPKSWPKPKFILHGYIIIATFPPNHEGYYFGGARSKGFATLRNVSKLTFFFDKIGHAKSVDFRFNSAI